MASLYLTKSHRFVAQGRRWGLDFSIWMLTRNLEAGVSLYPEPLLGPSEATRLEVSGFYDHFAAFFGLLGYERGWVTPGGNTRYTRILSSMAEAAPMVTRFLGLRLGKSDPPAAPKATPGDPRHTFRTFLEWGKRHRSKGWRVRFAEFRRSSQETAGATAWRTRRDLFVSPTHSCTWFFAWPPRSFGRRQWKGLETAGFFERSARELAGLGQRGRWRPGVFSDPDRLAAEFWKPEEDPRVSRKDFEGLLDWRLS